MILAPSLLCWPRRCRRRRDRPGRQPLEVDVVGGSVSAPMAIAVPAMPVAPGDRRARPPGRRSDRLRPALDRPVHAARARAASRGYTFGQAPAPAYAELAQRRRRGAGLRLCRAARRRPDDRRLLSLRRHRRARAGPPGLRRRRRRLAPRRAQMRRPRLFAPVGRAALSSTPASSMSPRPAPRTTAMKRIAIMDSDGSNHRYLTDGQATVVTPRFSPARRQAGLYQLHRPQARASIVLDIASGPRAAAGPRQPPSPSRRASRPTAATDRLLDGAQSGNTDIYVVDANGGTPRRLTSAPGADTSPSYLARRPPDRVRKRPLGTQQLYVMNADGSGQRRISFGGGRYASPVWSPRGDLIAFTRIAGTFRIGVMSAVGRRRADPDRRLAGRRAELGAQRPVRDVPPHRAAAAARHGSTRSRSTAARRGACRPRVGGSDPSWSPLNN